MRGRLHIRKLDTSYYATFFSSDSVRYPWLPFRDAKELRAYIAREALDAWNVIDEKLGELDRNEHANFDDVALPPAPEVAS